MGLTKGWKRDADDFYKKQESPKQIWVRKLGRKASVKLRAAKLPAARLGQYRSPGGPTLCP